MIDKVMTYRDAYGTDLPEVIVTEDANGARLSYHNRNGVLYPGRVWQSITPNGQYRVTFFLPFPDGDPDVLRVEGSSGAPVP